MYLKSKNYESNSPVQSLDRSGLITESPLSFIKLPSRNIQNFTDRRHYHV